MKKLKFFRCSLIYTQLFERVDLFTMDNQYQNSGTPPGTPPNLVIREWERGDLGPQLQPGQRNQQAAQIQHFNGDHVVMRLHFEIQPSTARKLQLLSSL